jgi:predicted DCC family thiol-disulfide oxidoreductase YuxK
MQAARQETPQKIYALYDGKCPLCQFGVKNYKLDCEYGKLDLVDMRETSALKEEAIAKGYNLDRSVVVKSGDNFYHAGDAIHFMAIRSDRSKWAGRQIYRLFRSRTRSRLLYPILRATRLCLLWLRSIPKIHEVSAEHKESTIKKQLGDAWNNLHPNVQKRFATEPTVSEQIFYRGTMETVECSYAGKVFAHFTRLIANPLTPYEGKNVQMDVLLYRKTGLAGVYWRRTYYYKGRTPYTVTSVKREDSKCRMTECVGAGFGMVLNVTALDGNLHFRSSRYFWQLSKLRIPLPHLLTPGETHVVHEDLRDGTFRFTIAMNHQYLGRTFYQTGIFREV